MRVVIDTNDYISALIGKKHREKIETIILNTKIEILADSVLFQEIEDVARRDKFKKYVTKRQIDNFISLLRKRLTPIITKSVITVSKDPDDNFLLALAFDGQADFLITGDKSHLLSLRYFNGIPIIRLDVFIILHNYK